MEKFSDIFVDCTSDGTKIPKDEYLEFGKNIIIDQGNNSIAGYTNNADGLYTDVPALIFGDHTRIIKYVDRPFFLGADGVKLLKSKKDGANYKYLYDALKNAKIPDTGYNRHFKWLKEIQIQYPDITRQKQIVTILDKLSSSIEKRKKELGYFDTLIKARFVEMFGDEKNSKKWQLKNIEDIADVQVGVVIKPAQYYTDEINGIKAFRSLNIAEGYIKDLDWVYFSEEGHKKNSKSILKENDIRIVRSGTPGVSCVVPKEYDGCNAIDIIIAHPDFSRVNSHYVCAFTNMPHGKNQIKEGTGGAAQQHFNVGKYNKMKIMLPPLELQKDFADFIVQINKSKVAVQKALDETQKLFDSLMQEYFG